MSPIDPNLLKKIKALLNLSDPEHGGTEAERDLALQKAQELMFKHDLEAFDLITEDELDHGVTHEEFMVESKTKMWMGQLLNDLSLAMNCRVVRTKYSVKKAKFTIIGTPDNIRFVKDIHAALIPWLQVENKLHKRRDLPYNPLAYDRAFYDAAGGRIYFRLKEQRDHLASQNAKGTELVLVRDSHNEDYIAKLFGAVRTGKGRQYKNQEGAIAGRRTGDRADLSRGKLNQ